MPSVRRSRTVIQHTGISGTVGALELPMIEGQAIVPKWLVVGLEQIDIGTATVVALNHNRSAAAPVSAAAVPGDDPAAWWWHSFDNSRGSQLYDMRDLDYWLAGSQSIQFWNGIGGARTLTIELWYETRGVPALEWAALAQATSFED